MMWSTMRNTPTDNVRSYGCRFGLYIVMIVTLWYASHIQIQSHLLMLTGTNEVTQALRFSAIMIMEQNEYQAAQSEEQREEEVAARYHHAAHYYHERAKEEEKEAVRSRTRSEYYDYLTEVDTKYENMTYHMTLSDDRLRLELLQNISQEEDRINALRQEQIEIDNSPCHSWLVFENFCTMVQVIPDRHFIESQKENELRALVQERAKLSEVEQDEYIYGIVTAILQGYASQYNHTAHELLQQSMEWGTKMRYDLQMTHEELDIAHEYDIVIQGQKEHIQQELLWHESNKLKSNTLLHNATYHLQLGRSYMQYSTVIGFFVLVYFVTVWIKRILWMISTFMVVAQQHVDLFDWSSSSSSGIYTILWYISYFTQHVLIFLVTCGLTLDVGSDGQHILRTISFFAFSAAVMKTTLLHALPHIVYGFVIPPHQNDTLHWSVFRRIGIQFLLRTIFYTTSFALELSITWLVARNIVFTKEHLALYQSGVFVLIFFVAVTYHNIVLEQRRWNKYSIDRLDEEATVLLNIDDNSSNSSNDDVSTATSSDTGRIDICSVGSHDVSTNPTERMPLLVLRGFAPTTTYSQSISSSSSQMNSMDFPNHLNIQWEFIKLLVLVDTLFVTYSILMLHHDGSTSMMMIVFVIGMMSVGVVIAAYLRFIYDHHYPTHGSNGSRSLVKGTYVDDEKHLSFSKSFQVYNSIDV